MAPSRLAKEPEHRYQTAGELAAEVHRYLRGEAIEARRDSSIHVFTRTLQRYRRVALAAVGFAAL